MYTYNEHRSLTAKQKLNTFIVDIDGTLALRGERDPYDYSRVGEDLPINPVVFVVQHLSLFSTIVIVSGRSEECRWQTEMWLHSYKIIFDDFFMREKKDNRSDHIVKKEIYEIKIRPVYKNILGVFDDRLSVIRMWEELGLFVFNCNAGKGEF